MLTPQRLIVGSEPFVPAEVDSTVGIQPPVVSSPGEYVKSEWKLTDDHDVRIAGGAWGRRVGTAMVVLREANHDRPVAIFTRRTGVLDPLLTEWIETVADPSG